MIKAVIFDCFGVLVGSGFWNVYRSLGGDPANRDDAVHYALKQTDLGKMSPDDLRRIMAEHLGITVDEYRAAYREDELPNLAIFEFIRNELKPHYKIGLLSNVSAGVIPKKIPPKLLKLFDNVVTSSEVGLIKPDPAIFQLAAKRLGVKPEEVIFTDDVADYVAGAQAAGMHAILYRSLEDFKHQFSKLVE